MGLKENNLISKILLNLPKNIFLFRINCGMAWTGKIIKQNSNTITLKNYRPFHGAPTGTPDLIGWQTITITPDMVGQKIAVFYGKEVKATGDLSPDQKKVRKFMIDSACFYDVAREDAELFPEKI